MTIWQSRAYENWAPVLGRVLMGGLFLFAATMKIPGTATFAMEVGMTAAAGVPFASVAVTLALILEVVGGLALILGWKTRFFAFLLTLFVALLTVLFHMNFGADPMAVGMFVNHLGLLAGLLYISVYGARHCAVDKA